MGASATALAFYLLSVVFLLVGGNIVAIYIASVAGLYPYVPAWLAAVGVAFLLSSALSYALYLRRRRPATSPCAQKRPRRTATTETPAPNTATCVSATNNN